MCRHMVSWGQCDSTSFVSRDHMVVRLGDVCYICTEVFQQWIWNSTIEVNAVHTKTVIEIFGVQKVSDKFSELPDLLIPFLLFLNLRFGNKPLELFNDYYFTCQEKLLGNNAKFSIGK